MSPGSVQVAAERVSGNSTRMVTRKHSRKSAAETEDSIVTPNLANGKVTASCALTEYLPEKALSCEVLPNVQLPECCKGVSANATDYGTCLFEVLIECLVGMKMSAISQTDGLCISALHQSSGYTFSLTWIKKNGRRGSRAGVPGIVVRDIRESGARVDTGCHYVQHKYVPRFLGEISSCNQVALLTGKLSVLKIGSDQPVQLGTVA
ncbi:uncharacterized protein LOC120144235 [Hibiscus syriacus]|nr:uncharacterized protein LOC120144235 [Hibiscus syriacus]